MAHRNLFASKNLDVPETSHDAVTEGAEGVAGNITPEPLLSVVCPDTARSEKQRRRYRPHGSKHLSLALATNMIEANRIVIGPLLDRLASAQGHILIRVAPGGATYQVIILDDAAESYRVQKTFGPIASQ